MRLISSGARKTTTAPATRAGGPAARVEREFVVERGAFSDGEGLGDGAFAGLAVLAVHEAEDLAGVLPEAVRERAAEQLLGLGVEVDDPALGIGEQHRLVQLREQRGEMLG